MCNFTYFTSLRFALNWEQVSGIRCYSVFVHVPPFQGVAEEEQQRFVKECLCAMAEELTALLDKDS